MRWSVFLLVFSFTPYIYSVQFAPILPDVAALVPSALFLCARSYMTNHVSPTVYFPTPAAQGMGLAVSTGFSFVHWGLENTLFRSKNR